MNSAFENWQIVLKEGTWTSKNTHVNVYSSAKGDYFFFLWREFRKTYLGYTNSEQE